MATETLTGQSIYLGSDLKADAKRWSRNFGPFVKVD